MILDGYQRILDGYQMNPNVFLSFENVDPCAFLNFEVAYPCAILNDLDFHLVHF